MASDILLYKTSHVPVGDDQNNIWSWRDIAGTFNMQFADTNNGSDSRPGFSLYPKEYSRPGTGAQVMSLNNGTKKMSKSDLSIYSRINLDDDNDTIAKKIRKAKTDSFTGFDPDSPR